MGQVNTEWTFASGQSVPLTFEVLANCCYEVVLGEEFLWGYNVFETCAESILDVSQEAESSELTPFGFIDGWQQRFGELKRSFKSRFTSKHLLVSPRQ